MHYVLDTNVAARFLWAEQLADDATTQLVAAKASQLLARFRNRTDQPVAPELIVPEFGHVLQKRHRRRELTVDEVRAFWQDFHALGIPTVPLATLRDLALDLALTHRAPYYDSVFVALAQVHGIHMITGDDRMVSRFAALDCVVHMKDVAL